MPGCLAYRTQYKALLYNPTPLLPPLQPPTTMGVTVISTKKHRKYWVPKAPKKFFFGYSSFSATIVWCNPPPPPPCHGGGAA